MKIFELTWHIEVPCPSLGGLSHTHKAAGGVELFINKEAAESRSDKLTEAAKVLGLATRCRSGIKEIEVRE